MDNGKTGNSALEMGVADPDGLENELRTNLDHSNAPTSYGLVPDVSTDYAADAPGGTALFVLYKTIQLRFTKPGQKPRALGSKASCDEGTQTDDYLWYNDDDAYDDADGYQFSVTPDNEKQVIGCDTLHAHGGKLSVPSGSPKTENQRDLGARLNSHLVKVYTKNATLLTRCFLVFLAIAFSVYFTFALLYSVSNAETLIILTSIFIFICVYVFIRDTFGGVIYSHALKPISELFDRIWPGLQWVVLPLLLIGFILYLFLFVIRDISQLQSFSGIIIINIFLYATSKHRTKIIWRPIIWGFGMQFVMAILVLRWKPGYIAVKWASDQVVIFMNYALEGAAVIFGDPFLFLHPIAFVSMPMLVYVGAVMAIMYHVGVTQLIAVKLGWVMQVTMGSTAIESLSVAASIFLNGMDTVLMVRRYVPYLTPSEFHCFLCGNHSTAAGFVIPLFIAFGAPAEYLISAAVMSAPATMAVCKLNWPETQVSITKDSSGLKLAEPRKMNIIEVASEGAAFAGKTIGAFIGSYVAFVGLIEFFNAFLSWFGGMVGYGELSFEIICSYLLFPLSIVMGVEWSEAREVAKLMGVKMFASEILAFQELGYSIEAGLSDRSASIATYALCGFSSASTLAIAVGVWNSLVPERAKAMAAQLLRVGMNANISCFLTACVAGLMYDPSMIDNSQDGSNIASIILGLIPSYKDILDLLPGY